ncbi:MAG: hypothetical protein IJE55_02940 [Clostridia bacterium]|nr:hypothetical protein [Clostridia bacterium]MBQ2911223.1 hypothetical protein [Clostridia bacterium]
MFDLREFIIVNLIGSYVNGELSKERVSLLAVNYSIKGLINTDDIEQISIALHGEDQ